MKFEKELKTNKEAKGEKSVQSDLTVSQRDCQMALREKLALTTELPLEMSKLFQFDSFKMNQFCQIQSKKHF